MSGPLAIAAVTAALKDLLNNGLLDHDLATVGSFSVTALPPDRITTGQSEPNQLNLFLYQLTPNPGWRNDGLPSRNGNGDRLTNPPLALDLHYLLTAYGSQDFNAEILLGYAMQLLHETPVLSRAQLRTVLGPVAPVGGGLIPSIFGTLSAIDLADQVELLKISPVTLSAEDLSKIWTAMQARYRPTMAYVVSVVLIQATSSVQAAPPVLKRGRLDRGPVAMATPYPTVTAVRPAASDLLPAMRLGDDIVLTGSSLNATGNREVVFENTRLGIERAMPMATVSPTTATVHVPSIVEDANAANLWSIGVHSVFVRVTRPDLPVWTSNGVPIALAPSITLSAANAAAGASLDIACMPRLRPEQEANALVLFGSQSIRPTSIDTPPGDTTQPTTVTFTVPAVENGVYVVRLRVEGVDSLPITMTGSPARLDFDAQQQVTVP
jgi:hypothetical protein